MSSSAACSHRSSSGCRAWYQGGGPPSGASTGLAASWSAPPAPLAPGLTTAPGSCRNRCIGQVLFRDGTELTRELGMPVAVTRQPHPRNSETGHGQGERPWFPFHCLVTRSQEGRRLGTKPTLGLWAGAKGVRRADSGTGEGYPHLYLLQVQLHLSLPRNHMLLPMPTLSLCLLFPHLPPYLA